MDVVDHFSRIHNYRGVKRQNDHPKISSTKSPIRVDGHRAAVQNFVRFENRIINEAPFDSMSKVVKKQKTEPKQNQFEIPKQQSRHLEAHNLRQNSSHHGHHRQHHREHHIKTQTNHYHWKATPKQNPKNEQIKNMQTQSSYRTPRTYTNRDSFCYTNSRISAPNTFQRQLNHKAESHPKNLIHQQFSGKTQQQQSTKVIQDPRLQKNPVKVPHFFRPNIQLSRKFFWV